MDGLGQSGAGKGLAIAFLSFCLAACAVATPVTITSVQSAPSAVTSLEFVPQDEGRGIRARFKTELARAFADQGVSVGPDADFLADFAVSERSAELALQNVTSDDANAARPASDYEPRWFHKCKPARVSASLVIYSKRTGALHSKSEGEFLACPGDTSQLSDLAGLLAKRALSD